MKTPVLYKLSALAVLVISIAVYARPGQALTVSAYSINPGASDITSLAEFPDGIEGYMFAGETNTEYTASFTVDEQPTILTVVGANNVTTEYNAEAGTELVTFTTTEMVGGPSGLPEGTTPFVIAMVDAGSFGENEPPVEATGMMMSTNISDWDIVPPSQETPAFGFNLSGPAGEVGNFHMFLPDATIELIGEFSGETITAASLAVFEDNDQVSLETTEVTGGLEIDITVTFTEDATTVAVGSTDESDTVSKQLTARPKLPISLAARDYTVRDGKKTTLYGWLKNGKANKTVQLWRKRGNGDYIKWKTTTTEADGYFSKRVTVNKTYTYKAKYRRTQGVAALTSSARTVTKR